MLDAVGVIFSKLKSSTVKNYWSIAKICNVYVDIYFQFAFEVITLLWDELYAYSGMKTLKNEIGPITEHVIVILKHLLKGTFYCLYGSKFKGLMKNVLKYT